jgi:PEP-CTERM motif
VFQGLDGKLRLKRREVMKMRWVLLTLVFACLGAMTQAQVPDGGIGIKHSLNSQLITSLSGPLTFIDCPGTTTEIMNDCALFGTKTQAVFAGQNGTSTAWNTLDLVLLGYDPVTDHTLGCFGNTLFKTCTITPGSDCTLTSTSCSLNVDFLQGTGTGIGCTPGFNGCPSGDGDGDEGEGDESSCGADAACAHFTVGIGGTDALNFNTRLSLTGGSFAADPTPEPQTLLLVGIAILGMAFFASKKGLLACR